MNLAKIWIIARREYWINVRRPGFLILTLMVPALGAVALFIGTFFSGQATDFLQNIFVPGSQVTGIVDRFGQFTPILPEYQEDFVLFDNESAGREAVMNDEIRRLLVIPPDYLETGTVTVITSEGALSVTELEDSPHLRGFFVDHLLRDFSDETLRARLRDPVDPVVIQIGAEEEPQGGMVGMVLGFVVPYMLSILLIMTVFVSSGYLLNSVSEEKTSRVIEIILSSVTAQELLAGKVIGLGALGLTQMAFWLTTAGGLAGSAVGLLGVAIPLLSRPEVFLLAIVYYVLGFLVYAVLMGSVGALGADKQEAQQLAGIFSFMAAIPFFFVAVVFTSPGAPLIRVLSWIPLTAPTMMMLRIPQSQVPAVDIIGSIVVLLVTIPGILWLGGKLFRMGLLMYGKRPSVPEIWRQLRQA
jgi:ABC-2 type transport system permease protein